MKRVFFYTGYHMVIFEFDGNVFVGSLDFYDTEAGIEEFSDYIASAVPAQSFMLVDLQEEDFRTESLPHVRGKDQKQIISRLERKIFRDLDYHQTVSLGRSRQGRKDDLYMFSSLLNSESLDKWMRIFAELHVPICGIWSVSYLGALVVSKLGLREDNILLFSRQMRSAIRETIFKNGKIIISRQAKLERRVRNDHSAETLATILASNVDVMHRFLINQRMVSYADSISVYAIVQDELIEKAKSYCDDSNTLKFTFVGINRLFELFKVKNCASREADVLFAYLCSTQQPTQQQYLPKSHRAPYNRFLLSQLIRNASLVLGLIFLVIGSFLLLNANEYKIETHRLSQKMSTLVKNYNQFYSAEQDKIDNADLVKNTVELMSGIRSANAITPHSKFSDLSVTLSKPQFERFTLDALNWQKYSPRQLQAIISEYKDPAVIPNNEEVYFDDNESTSEEFQSVLRIRGRLDKADLSYHQAVRLMDEFTVSIKQMQGVETVHVVESPVDVRVGKKFSDRSGVESLASSEESAGSRFDLRLIFTPSRSDDHVDE